MPSKRWLGNYCNRNIQRRPPNCTAQREDNIMTISTFGFALMTMASVGACLGQDLASPADPPPLGPVRIVAEEPGVVPAGSSLVVQTNDAVTAVRAMRATIYSANVAEDVVDQDGTVLIPKDSPVELGVRSLSYLGPGGAAGTGSTNWSGFELRGATNSYFAVEAEWYVPSVSAETGIATYSTIWIGLDGDGTSDLVQDGTEQDINSICYSSGCYSFTNYFAWTAFLPQQQVEQVIANITVSPHDEIYSDVTMCLLVSFFGCLPVPFGGTLETASVRPTHPQ
jgi:hypothetical protein